MHDIRFEYDPSNKPHCVEIEKITIGTTDVSYDTSWIEKTGEVILKVFCVDGIVILIRRDFYSIKDGENVGRCSME